MPSKLSKVRKHVTKKKGAKIHALHENSRDAIRLRRAAARDERVSSTSSTKEKQNRPWLDRVAFFQANLPETLHPLEIADTQTLIEQFLARHDEEVAALKAERRPGRPASTRQTLLEQQIKTEHAEYESGFWVPNMQDEEALQKLDVWNGSWLALAPLRFVRVDKAGGVKDTTLLEVDKCTTLVACTRVSRTFANIISSSIALQRALWFRLLWHCSIQPLRTPKPFFVACGAEVNVYSLHRGIKASQMMALVNSEEYHYERIMESTNYITLETFPPLKHQYGSWLRMVPWQNPNGEGKDPLWVLDFHWASPDVAPSSLTLYDVNACGDDLQPPGLPSIAKQGVISIFGQQKSPPKMEELIMFSATHETTGN
ncbi:hypothetical protein AC579_2518 [Pseudocercospora musae]|uniref:Uncharacterized protein n=1 Tax=Pseudocercospora musae TaxID=113226 RepID=A0A139I412_9PEZI|nr:hypothetical protein AC579_2518 [Pseudocercospora musae]